MKHNVWLYSVLLTVNKKGMRALKEPNNHQLRFLVLFIKRKLGTIHIVVPALSRLLSGREETGQPVAAQWPGNDCIILNLHGRPALILGARQPELLKSYLETASVPILLTDHNNRFRTWIGPLSDSLGSEVGDHWRRDPA